jgi:hypothetical protein
MNQADSTLTPKLMIESYQRAYRYVHGHSPAVRHQFGEWYHVNGEIVPRSTLLAEITRLRSIAQKQRLQAADKSLVNRLIARLRGI